jgi:hypothetical protein
MTARIVLLTGGADWAMTWRGSAAATAPAAKLVFRTVRRVVFIAVLPVRGFAEAYPSPEVAAMFGNTRAELESVAQSRQPIEMPG